MLRAEKPIIVLGNYAAYPTLRTSTRSEHIIDYRRSRRSEGSNRCNGSEPMTLTYCDRMDSNKYSLESTSLSFRPYTRGYT